MSDIRYEWYPIWVISDMSYIRYEWYPIWVISDMSDIRYEWYPIWVISDMSDIRYEWYPIWVISDTSDIRYEWYPIWVISDMSSFEGMECPILEEHYTASLRLGLRSKKKSVVLFFFEMHQHAVIFVSQELYNRTVSSVNLHKLHSPLWNELCILN